MKRAFAVVLKAGVLVALVWGIAFAWAGLCREYPHAREGTFARRIDSYLPNLNELKPEVLRSPKEAARFLAYYQLIDAEFPGMPGVQEMLGYCHYYSGDKARALAYYEKALRGWPESFVARFDLGVIYYQKGNVTRALEYFQSAIDLNEARAFGYLMSSRVFSQLRIGMGLKPLNMLQHLRGEYADAKRYIRLCMEKQGRSDELVFLALRFKDLHKVWSENGGQPVAAGLILF